MNSFPSSLPKTPLPSPIYNIIPTPRYRNTYQTNIISNMVKKTITSTISEQNIDNTKLHKIKPNTKNLNNKNRIHNTNTPSPKYYRLHSTSINNTARPHAQKSSTSDKTV